MTGALRFKLLSVALIAAAAAPGPAVALEFVFSGTVAGALAKLSETTGFPLSADIAWARQSTLGRVVVLRWLNKKVSLEMRNCHLPHILAEISKQAGVCVTMRAGVISASAQGRPIDPSVYTPVGDYCVAAYRIEQKAAYAARVPGQAKASSPLTRIVLEVWADTRDAGWRLAGISDDTVLVCPGRQFHLINVGQRRHKPQLYIGAAGPLAPVPPLAPLSVPRQFHLLFRTDGAVTGGALLEGRLMTYAKGPWSGDIPLSRRGHPTTVGPTTVTLRRHSARADYASLAIELPAWMTPGQDAGVFCNIVGLTVEGRERPIDTTIVEAVAPGIRPRRLMANRTPFSTERARDNARLTAVRVRLWFIAPENGRPVAEFSVPVRVRHGS